MFSSIARSFNFFSRREKITYLILLFSRIVANFLDIAGVAAIGLLGAAAASGFLEEREASFLGFTVDLAEPNLLLTVMFLVAAFFFLKALIQVGLIRTTAYFLANVEIVKSTEIAQFLFTGDLGNLRKYSRSEVQWAVTGSTNVTFSGMLGSAGMLVTETALLLFMFTLFVVVDPLAAVAITAYFAVILAGFQALSSKKMKQSGKDLAEGNMDVTQATLNLFDAFKEISVLMRQHYFLAKFRSARTQYSYGDARSRFLMAIPRYFVETALALGALAFVAWQLARGELLDGLVTAGVFLTGGVRMMAALLPLQNALMAIRNQTEPAKIAQELLELAGDSSKKVTSVSISPERNGMTEGDLAGGVDIELNSVRFCYPDASFPAIDNITLRIEPGTYVAIVGPSGAGKTTLADLILGLHEPESGSVNVDGVSATAVRHIRPGLMAYVPQRPGLVSGTLLENIALGQDSRSVDFDQVTAVLEKARLIDVVEGLPDGVHTRLGKNSDSLSGGQVQRLGLARALYTNPKLIVLDEATSALDAEAEASISESIRKMGIETTVIVIAHRLSTVQKADVVHVIDNGKLVASGSFKDLRRTVPMIQEYVRLMSFDED